MDSAQVQPELEPRSRVADSVVARPRQRNSSTWGRRDTAFLALIVVGVCLLEVWLRAMGTRPLWYDELWRAYYLSVPRSHFWNELSRANAPSAAGWMAVTRASADVFGWRPWALRLPELLVLPLIGAGMYTLTRRFTGPLIAFGAAALVGFSGTVLDLGWELKPYSVELVAAIAVVVLWAGAPAPGCGTTVSRITRRTLAGAVTVFTVPLAFLLAPLAAADVLLARGGWRVRVRAAAETAPALVITAAHSILFVARQSGQRNGPFWDPFFLTGRGLGGSLRFIWTQLVDIASTSPPGVDRNDANVVHPLTNGTFAGTWLLAPAFAVAFVIGAPMLLRRRDGQIVLAGLLGAELLILVASGLRYWPFGPVRTNLFLVPLLTVVAAAGICGLCRQALKRRLLLAPALALLAVAGLALGSALDTTWRLSERRYAPRPIDRLPLASDEVRHALRPGDLVIVAGRLVRPGWIYVTQVRAGAPAGLPALPASQTVFVPFGGDGIAAHALKVRPPPSGRVLLFDLILEQADENPELRELSRSGWCPVQPPRVLAGTGRLTVLEACHPG